MVSLLPGRTCRTCQSSIVGFLRSLVAAAGCSGLMSLTLPCCATARPAVRPQRGAVICRLALNAPCVGPCPLCTCNIGAAYSRQAGREWHLMITAGAANKVYYRPIKADKANTTACGGVAGEGGMVLLCSAGEETPGGAASATGGRTGSCLRAGPPWAALGIVLLFKHVTCCQVSNMLPCYQGNVAPGQEGGRRCGAPAIRERSGFPRPAA
jgi:hypothetical protein